MPIQTEITTATHWIEKWIALIKAHERLLIVLLVLSFGYHAYGSWLDYDSARKDAQVAALTQKVSQDAVDNKNLAITASTAAAQFQAALDSATKQNAALAASLQRDDALLANNRRTDASLDLPALAVRIQQITPGTQPGSIDVENNRLTMADPAAHAIASQLEAVPVLTNELLAANSTVAADQLALGKSSTALTACTDQVGGLQKSLTDQQAHETAAVAAEKTKTKKAWRNGFKWGFAAGAALVGMLTHGI